MTTRIPELDLAAALEARGAAFIDLRPIDEYLDIHIPGSMALVYESGPGMAARARDCFPLDLPLILLEDERVDMGNAAASLRGKGFEVLGAIPDAIARWGALRGRPTSTDVYEGADIPGGTMLDVGDPGVRIVEGARRIPAETLWTAAGDLDSAERYVVTAGYGVRAGLAVGILERAGVTDLVFWKTRASDSFARVPLGAQPL